MIRRLLVQAFDAPLLQSCGSNASGLDIGKSLGDVELQYGASGIRRPEPSSTTTTSSSPIDYEKICFVHSAFVRRPTNVLS